MTRRERMAGLRFAARSQAKAGFARMGVDVRRVRSSAQVRPVGDMRSFLEHLRARSLMVTDALDVGANRGDWARLATEVFPECRVAMIEPQVEMGRYLDAFCRSHPGSSWVCAGAGARPDHLALSIRPDLSGSTFLSADDGGATALELRTVPVVTIDALLEEDAIRMPHLVKIDIQGFELEALRGANSLFGVTEVFIIETSLVRPLKGQPLIDEVVAFMRSRGYRVYDLAGFLRRPSDGALGQIDVCFARDSGRLFHSETW